MQELTETKQALSERLVQILEANEAASCASSRSRPAARHGAAGPGGARENAGGGLPRPPSRPSPVAGFDESEAAEASWEVSTNVALSAASPARGAG